MFDSDMFISLPPPVISSTSRRRPPLTPPSVSTYVSTTCSSVGQSFRDRCRSPQRSASAYLARVASSPNSPTLSSLKDTSSLPSLYTMSRESTPPASVPREEGHQFPFGFFTKSYSFCDVPEGQYISFPAFEDLSGESGESEDEDSESS